MYAILKQPKNLKHKAILWTIYSGGFRLSEVLNLRIEDIRSVEGYIFVKAAKGKKDRRTILSDQLLKILREYYYNSPLNSRNELQNILVIYGHEKNGKRNKKVHR